MSSQALGQLLIHRFILHIQIVASSAKNLHFCLSTSSVQLQRTMRFIIHMKWGLLHLIIIACLWTVRGGDEVENVQAPATSWASSAGAGLGVSFIAESQKIQLRANDARLAFQNRSGRPSSHSYRCASLSFSCGGGASACYVRKLQFHQHLLWFLRRHQVPQRWFESLRQIRYAPEDDCPVRGQPVPP